MLKDKTVLVTGAGGFIGSHLAEALVRKGAKVRAFVRYNSRQDWGLLSQLDAEALSQVEVVSGDLRDPHAVEHAAQGVTTIFHLGALIAIPYSYVHPDEVVSVNVLGTLNVLNAARKCGVERLVHTSTSEVYGSALYVPMDEKHPLQGQSPYSASKIGADKLVESFWRSFGLTTVTIRPFNTYGPRQSTRAVIPTIITQALTSDRVLLGNLDPRRDLMYVSDTVEGFLKAATAPQVSGMEINLGTGRDVSIGDLARLLVEIIGRPVEVVTDMERVRPKDSEVDRLCADNSLAARVLGWSPQVSLGEGLTRTVEWVRSHLPEYRLIGRYTI
jgi:NAD dependent epimerase/dehydratase